MIKTYNDFIQEVERMHLPDILLHICCAPCSTCAIVELKKDYNVRVFFFNPNMFPPDEYRLRLSEARWYMNSLNIELLVPDYRRQEWLDETSFLGNDPEGGERCRLCYAFRLNKTAKVAQALNIPCFSTTLTVGPAKPASVIFPVAQAISKRFGVSFIAKDFKKKDGFKTSCLMSRSLGMYRQNYCGCEYSLRDRNKRLRLPKREDSRT
jgi:predicted adenine nucleotide alpha hydrolase (AANH) superfamily ATPase